MLPKISQKIKYLGKRIIIFIKKICFTPNIMAVVQYSIGIED